jgi:hypothetical protein
MKRMLASLATVFALILGSTTGALAQDKKPVKPEGGIAGLVKKVDDKSITLAIVTQKGQPAEEKAFDLAADVKISVLGKEAKRTEIVVDKPAHLTLNADKKVVAVSQDKQGDKGVKGDKGAAGISGPVKKVDDKSITLSIVTQKGQPAEDQTFQLAADVKVSVLGKAAKVTEVMIDKPAHLTLNADKNVVAVSQDKLADKGEKGAGVSGTLKKVDDKSITLSITTKKGQPAEDQTFPLAADVKVSVFGQPGKVGDIKADKPVQLKLDADKKVIAISQVEKTAGGINGVVKKIDDKANTITLAVIKNKGQPAEDETFTVTADAKIVVFGKPAKLSEIAADKPANIALNADKKVVSIAQGKGEKPQK